MFLGLKNLFLALLFILVTKRLTIVVWVQCTLKDALLKSKVKWYYTVIRNSLSYLGSRGRLVGFSNLKFTY